MGQRSDKLLHDAVVSPPLALLFIPLPRLQFAGQTLILRLSAPGGVRLLALLASGSAVAADFATVLASEPGLAAWCLLRAGDKQLRTISALAGWLAGAWQSALCWTNEGAEADLGLSEGASVDRDSFARRIATAQLTAELATQIARHAGKDSMADLAYLAGLVAGEFQSLAEFRNAAAKLALKSELPSWIAALTGESSKPSRRHLPCQFAWQAGSLLNGLMPANGRSTGAKLPRNRLAHLPNGFAFDAAAWIARGKSLVAQYRTPLAGLEQFAAAIERLARITRLECDFERQLEKSKIDALKELAYGAGHEINNPLANISARAQTLIKEEANPERRRKLAQIHAQAMRAHEMIADMMFFARPPHAELRKFDLTAFVDELLPAIRQAAKEQQTAVEWSRPELPIIVCADRAQLAVALRALCINALEALHNGGRLTVELGVAAATSPADSSQNVQIAVVDNGPGIPAEVRPHLFEPFYSGREAGRGLGLGLCKCWRIAELHGGRIDVESAAGSTRFTISLPR